MLLQYFICIIFPEIIDVQHKTSSNEVFYTMHYKKQKYHIISLLIEYDQFLMGNNLTTKLI